MQVRQQSRRPTASSCHACRPSAGRVSRCNIPYRAYATCISKPSSVCLLFQLRFANKARKRSCSLLLRTFVTLQAAIKEEAVKLESQQQQQQQQQQDPQAAAHVKKEDEVAAQQQQRQQQQMSGNDAGDTQALAEQRPVVVKAEPGTEGAAGSGADAGIDAPDAGVKSEAAAAAEAQQAIKRERTQLVGASLCVSSACRGCVHANKQARGGEHTNPHTCACAHIMLELLVRRA